MKKAIAFTVKKSFIFLVIALVLSVSSCDLFGEKEDPPGYLGSTLTISGAQVYDLITQQPLTDLNVTITKIFDNTKVGALIGNSVEVIEAGKITNGKFSIKLGTPKIFTGFTSAPTPSGITVSDTNAKIYQTGGFFAGDTGTITMLYTNFDTTNTVTSSVSYIYTDRDLTMKGTGIDENVDLGISTTVTMDIELKTGWNTVIGEVSVPNSTVTVKSGVPGEAYKWSAGIINF